MSVRGRRQCEPRLVIAEGRCADAEDAELPVDGGAGEAALSREPEGVADRSEGQVTSDGDALASPGRGRGSVAVEG